MEYLMSASVTVKKNTNKSSDNEVLTFREEDENESIEEFVERAYEKLKEIFLDD